MQLTHEPTDLLAWVCRHGCYVRRYRIYVPTVALVDTTPTLAEQARFLMRVFVNSVLYKSHLLSAKSSSLFCAIEKANGRIGRSCYSSMALPFPHPEALLPPGFTMSRATPEDAPGMTDVW